MTDFADIPARIAAVLTDSDVGVEHSRDHDPEGCAACFVLDGTPGLSEGREQEIRRHVEEEILPTADEVAGILRSGWSPSDRLRLQQACRELLAALDAERAQRGVLQHSVAELERERAGLLARAEQAEAERDYAIKRYAESCGASTEPIPPEDLERAAQFVREQGWVAADAALAGPGDPEEPPNQLAVLIEQALGNESPPCPHCGPTTRWTGERTYRCVGGCYWPDGEQEER